jgi:hypothetical protein
MMRRRPDRSAGMLARGNNEPRFVRFAAAMDAARAAKAPELALYRDEGAAARPLPAAHRPPLRPAAVRWRSRGAPRRPVVRWLGISCSALLLGILLVNLLALPSGAEIERLFGEWFGPERRGDTAAGQPQTDQAAAVIADPVRRADRLVPPRLLTPPAVEDNPTPRTLVARSIPADLPPEAGAAAPRAAKGPPLPELKPASASH